MSWKHCGKRRNCSFWAISSFVTIFSKVVCCRCVRKRLYEGKNLQGVNTIWVCAWGNMQVDIYEQCRFRPTCPIGSLVSESTQVDGSLQQVNIAWKEGCMKYWCGKAKKHIISKKFLLQMRQNVTVSGEGLLTYFLWDILYTLIPVIHRCLGRRRRY